MVKNMKFGFGTIKSSPDLKYMNPKQAFKLGKIIGRSQGVSSVHKRWRKSLKTNFKLVTAAEQGKKVWTKAWMKQYKAGKWKPQRPASKF